MLYLATGTAYLGAVTGLVAAWKKFVAVPGEKADLTIYAIAGILALPLLFAFLFNLLPAIRRRRERHSRPVGKDADDYFDTTPRDADPYGFFREGYEPFLTWAREPRPHFSISPGFPAPGNRHSSAPSGVPASPNRTPGCSSFAATTTRSPH